MLHTVSTQLEALRPHDGQEVLAVDGWRTRSGLTNSGSPSLLKQNYRLGAPWTPNGPVVVLRTKHNVNDFPAEWLEPKWPS